MHFLRALVVAGAVLGLSSAAVAAPVAVTYGFGGPPASFSLAGSGSVGNVTQGSLTVVYASGSPLASGTVGPMSTATLQGLQLYATGVSLYIPQLSASVAIPGWQVGNLTQYSAFLGFNGPFSVMATVNITATAAVKVINIAPGLVAFNGFGNMWIPALALGPHTWEVDDGGNGNIIGQEISRQVVPEPASGLMVLAGLCGLALYGGQRRLRR